VGLSISVVEDSLLKYEMKLGTITDRVAELLPPGQVLSQSPQGGVGVPPDTAVDLVVSVRLETNPNGE
jgi:beta-lactam-binding protein with PASTA domain